MAVSPSPLSSITDTITSNVKARGLAVIITNDYSSSQCRLDPTKARLEPLPGTAVDGEAMKSALKNLGFAVHWAKNVELEGFTKIVNEVRSYPHYRRLRNYKCIIFIFSGHGDSGDIVYLHDGSQINVDNEIIDPFQPESGYNLASLPKLFFIDACRGEKSIETISVPVDCQPRGKAVSMATPDARGGNKVEVKYIPKKGGILKAYSTMSDYRAWERKTKGGVWLQLLAQEIQTSRCSIEDVLATVNHKLINNASPSCIQQPEKVSTLNNIVHLHPDMDDKGKKDSEIRIAAVFSPPLTTLNSFDSTQDKDIRKPTPISPAPGTSVDESLNQQLCPCMNKLITHYPTAKAAVQDTPFFSSEHGVTFYHSRVTVNIPGLLQSCIGDSQKYFKNTQLSRNAAVEDALSKLATAKTSQSYWKQLDTFFKAKSIRPEVIHECDSTADVPRHRCIVRYTLNSQQKKVKSRYFCSSKEGAKEQVAEQVLLKENVIS